jgi:hypothetical protein
MTVYAWPDPIFTFPNILGNQDISLFFVSDVPNYDLIYLDNYIQDKNPQNKLAI